MMARFSTLILALAALPAVPIITDWRKRVPPPVCSEQSPLSVQPSAPWKAPWGLEVPLTLFAHVQLFWKHSLFTTWWVGGGAVESRGSLLNDPLSAVQPVMRLLNEGSTLEISPMSLIRQHGTSNTY